MITFSKQENGVLFTFENSDKYLYGDGTILVPFNSLAVIQDESDMITLRKSASWDIFLSGRFDTDFNYGSKEDAVDALKEALFDESGGGVTEEEVEQMIDAATSGIPSSQVVEQLRTDVNTISGTVSSHTANTEVHVTQAEKNTWNGKVDEGYVTDYAYSKNQIDGFLENATTLLQTISGEVDTKQDILTAGANITISGNVISAEAGNNIIELTQEEYDALTEKDPDALYIITDAQEINMNDYYTKSEVDASIATKADTSALTAVQDSLSGYVTTTTYESGQYATAQALNALQENKLDASAYTPTDLSQYWTSSQTVDYVDSVITDNSDIFVVNWGSIRSQQIMTDELWNNLMYAIDNNKPIFGYIENQPNAIFDEIYPLQALAMDVYGIKNIRLTLVAQTYSITVDITKNGSDDYTIVVDGFEFQTKLTAGSGISIDENNVISATGGSTDLSNYYTKSETNDLLDDKLDASAYTPTDLSEYWTSGQTQEAINAATSGKVDTSAITTSITSGSTDSEIPTAKAVYDATQGGGGGMDDDTQQLISTAFNDLNDRKADLTELTKYQKKGDYVETSTLADYMTNDAFDEYATAKERIISGALNDLNDKFGGLRLIKISQSDYDQLATKDSSTLYIISD